MADSLELSDQTVNHFAWGAFATGFLPSLVPGAELAVDAAGVFGVQLWMLKRLSEGFGYTWNDQLGKEVVGSLVGSLAAANLGFGGVGFGMASALGFVPVVGPVLRLGITPGFNYLSTVAIGRVFEKHFASGGTLLSFDLETMKKQVVREYTAARHTFFAFKSAVAEKLSEEVSALRKRNEEMQQQIDRLKAEMSVPDKAPARRA